MNRGKARKYIKRIMARHLASRDDASRLEHEIFGAWIGDSHLMKPGTTEKIIEATATLSAESPISSEEWFKQRYRNDPNAFDNILSIFCTDLSGPEEITDELCDDFIKTVQIFFAGTVMFGDEGTGKEDRHFLYEPE